MLSAKENLSLWISIPTMGQREKATGYFYLTSHLRVLGNAFNTWVGAVMLYFEVG